MTITVTLGSRPELTTEERAQRIRRATEALEGVGWLFDEYISDMTKTLLDSDDDALLRRDQLYRSIRAAADLKGRLVQIVNSKALEDKRNAAGSR
jgi:hypothetical protein